MKLYEVIKRNLANFTTILGVLPLILLFYPEFFQFLPVIIIFNNIMDDLDGILARELKIASKFGANLDNLSDTLSHVVILWTIMVHYNGIILLIGLITTTSVLIRVSMRLDDSNPMKGGSPTNELIRHIFFSYLLSIQFQINITWLLVFVLIIHSFSLVVPFDMPNMIRSKSKSVIAITFVNFLLILAWLFPLLNLFIASSFLITYLYSLCLSGLNWLKTKKILKRSRI